MIYTKYINNIKIVCVERVYYAININFASFRLINGKT